MAQYRNIKRQVLQRAVDIWKDPKHRCRFNMHRRYYLSPYSGEVDQYCALGVLRQGLRDAGIKESLGHTGLQELAELIGVDDYGVVFAWNDSGGRLGRWLLYRRMKRYLKREIRKDKAHDHKDAC